MNTTTDKTEAYARALPRTWRDRTEHTIERLGDAYQALWDIMPAIAAFGTLLLLLNSCS